MASHEYDATTLEAMSVFSRSNAAKCRSEADWLVGINGTRAMTAFNNRVSETGFFKTTVGRVQTPTLAILVEREEKIRAFKPRDYWEVHARFGAKAGEERDVEGAAGTEEQRRRLLPARLLNDTHTGARTDAGGTSRHHRLHALERPHAA